VSRTDIRVNGSKWAGEAPDSIETLLSVLAGSVLDSAFFPFAANVPGSPGVVCYFGNFEDVSHAFDIRTDDPDVCARLNEAIKANLGYRKGLAASR